MRVRKLLIRLVVVLVVLVGVFALWVLVRSGQLRSLEPMAIGDCTMVEGAPGAEDLVVDRGQGVAFVSSLDRRALAAGEVVDGRILAYDLGSRELTDVTPAELTGFRPHGLSLYQADGEALLFVVNHPPAAAGGVEHAVEILRFDGERFQLVESVTGDPLVSPNDVVAVGPRSFYVTNDHGAAAGWRRFAEDALGLARGSVVYFDGETMTRVADRIPYANGIAASRYGREIYVAGTTHGILYIYARDLETGALGEAFEMPLGTGLDNIEVDRHGMLWIAAHPKLLSLFRHRFDAEALSPSQVLWVDTDQSADPPVRPVYLNLGDELSGSTVAVPFGSRLLIGSVFEGFLDCERDS